MVFFVAFSSEIIPILILVILGFIIGGIYLIVENIFKIVIIIMLVLIDIGVYVLFCKIFHKLYEKTKNKWFWVSFISITIFWFGGLLFFLGLEGIDKPGIYMKILGNNKLIQYFIAPLVIILFTYLIFLGIAYFCKQKVLQSFMCVLPVFFLFVFMNYSASICTKSYSDSMIQEFMNMENISEHTVRTEAKIYYPAFGDGAKEFVALPMFSPIKYSRDSFKSGDIIFVYETTINSALGTEYVKASDGKKIGYIKTEAVD